MGQENGINGTDTGTRLRYTKQPQTSRWLTGTSTADPSCPPANSCRIFHYLIR